MTQDINIDALLADSWLTVTELRLGAKLAEGEGKHLWQRCVDNIEQVMAQLVTADISEANRQHILYAWCALLDETAKGRNEEDDACIAWYDRPLEVKYFGGMEAGDALYERIRQVLREPAPDNAVLTCFHRVLALGLRGGMASMIRRAQRSSARFGWSRVPPFAGDPQQPILANLSGRRGLADWLRRWPISIGVSLVLVAALWLGLNYWLDAWWRRCDWEADNERALSAPAMAVGRAAGGVDDPAVSAVIHRWPGAGCWADGGGRSGRAGLVGRQQRERPADADWLVELPSARIDCRLCWSAATRRTGREKERFTVRLRGAG